MPRSPRQPMTPGGFPAVRVMNIHTGEVSAVPEIHVRTGERDPDEVILGRLQTHVVVQIRATGELTLVSLADYQQDPGRYIHPHTIVVRALRGRTRPAPGTYAAWPTMPSPRR